MLKQAHKSGGTGEKKSITERAPTKAGEPNPKEP